jgi:hypothetical protein
LTTLHERLVRGGAPADLRGTSKAPQRGTFGRKSSRWKSWTLEKASCVSNLNSFLIFSRIDFTALATMNPKPAAPVTSRLAPVHLTIPRSDPMLIPVETVTAV